MLIRSPTAYTFQELRPGESRLFRQMRVSRRTPHNRRIAYSSWFNLNLFAGVSYSRSTTSVRMHEGHAERRFASAVVSSTVSAYCVHERPRCRENCHGSLWINDADSHGGVNGRQTGDGGRRFPSTGKSQVLFYLVTLLESHVPRVFR